MNILRIIENKSVIYLSLLLYFIFLYFLLSQQDSSFVGFGFGFLWVISLFTKHIVVCVTGSILLTCLLIVLRKTKEGMLLGNRCNAICFEQNRDISTQNDALQGTNNELNGKNNELKSNIISLNTIISSKETENQNLNIKNTQMNNRNIRLKNRNSRLKTKNNNLTRSTDNYRRLVDSIYRISSS